MDENSSNIIDKFGVSPATVFAQAVINDNAEIAKRTKELEEKRKNLAHQHDNVLAERLTNSEFRFALQNKIIQKCGCGRWLVLKPYWANGQKIKVTSINDNRPLLRRVSM